MVGSKQLNNKLKSTPKMFLRNKQVLIQEDNTTPRSSSTNETTRKIVKGEVENHEEKVSEIIKTHLENTNNRLDRISQEAFETTKSLEFTQGQLDEELTKIKKMMLENFKQV